MTVINLISDWPKSEVLRWSHLIKEIEEKPRPKMAEFCGDIESDGRLNDCLLGCKTSVAWLFVTNIILKTFLAWFNLAVSLSS